MAHTETLPAETDFTAMDYRMGELCGDNAMNWARAFCQIARSKGIDLGDDPEGWMVGWFANAIENADMTRNGGWPKIMPDGSAHFVA